MQASTGMARSGALRACSRSCHFCKLRSSHCTNSTRLICNEALLHLSRRVCCAHPLQGDRGTDHPCKRVWPILPGGRTTWKCICRHHHGHRLRRFLGVFLAAAAGPIVFLLAGMRGRRRRVVVLVVVIVFIVSSHTSPADSCCKSGWMR